MLEVEVKLSAMPLEGKKRVPYKAILKFLLCNFCNKFTTFMVKLAAFWKLSPDSRRLTFRVSISVKEELSK